VGAAALKRCMTIASQNKAFSKAEQKQRDQTVA